MFGNNKYNNPKNLLILIIRIALAAVMVIIVTMAMKSNADAAELEYVNDDTGYHIIVDDQADLLSPDEEEKLVDDMKGISLFGNVAFVSIDYNPKTSAQSFSESYCYSNFGNESSMVFLIDMDYRKLIISADGEIFKTITVGKSNSITDNVYKLAGKGQYYECAAEVYKEANALLNGAKIAEPMKIICNAILSLIAAMLILFIFVTSVSNARRASVNKLIEGASRADVHTGQIDVRHTNTTRRYSPRSKSSGGSSGGGGGGGGFSGGSGGHSF